MKLVSDHLHETGRFTCTVYLAVKSGSALELVMLQTTVLWKDNSMPSARKGEVLSSAKQVIASTRASFQVWQNNSIKHAIAHCSCRELQETAAR
jgi:hypothetical protein